MEAEWLITMQRGETVAPGGDYPVGTCDLELASSPFPASSEITHADPPLPTNPSVSSLQLNNDDDDDDDGNQRAVFMRPPLYPGADCSYYLREEPEGLDASRSGLTTTTTPTTSTTTSTSTLRVHAHSPDTCCKSCAATTTSSTTTTTCVGAVYHPPAPLAAAAAAKNFPVVPRHKGPGPQPGECFGLHVTSVPGHQDDDDDIDHDNGASGHRRRSLSVKEVEAAFAARLGEMHHFDPFLDYNVRSLCRFGFLLSSLFSLPVFLSLLSLLYSISRILVVFFNTLDDNANANDDDNVDANDDDNANANDDDNVDAHRWRSLHTIWTST